MIITSFIGPPGAGKGTQARLLADRLNITCVSVGEILRKMAQSDSDDARALNSCLLQGKLAPVELVNKVVAEFLECNVSSCILDGYPRSLEQAKFLEVIKCKIQVVYFEIDDETIVNRIVGRFNCVDCGKIYNTYYSTPKVQGVCDVCSGTEFYLRSDDTKDSVINRIAEYKQETYPVIEYYRRKDVFHMVDAKKSPEEIFNTLSKTLKLID